MSKPKRPPYQYAKPFPRKPRMNEVIGGGYFVFRRGDSTGRIRPSMWPFEHGSLESALIEARRLSSLAPGHRYDVVQVAAHVVDAEESDIEITALGMAAIAEALGVAANQNEVAA